MTSRVIVGVMNSGKVGVEYDVKFRFSVVPDEVGSEDVNVIGDGRRGPVLAFYNKEAAHAVKDLLNSMPDGSWDILTEKQPETTP